MSEYIYEIYKHEKGWFSYYYISRFIEGKDKRQWLEYSNYLGPDYSWWSTPSVALERMSRFGSMKSAEERLLAWLKKDSHSVDDIVADKFNHDSSVVQMKTDGKKILIDRLIDDIV